MLKAEKLPQNQPAEIHIDGMPMYAGVVSGILERGLLMSESEALQGTQAGRDIAVQQGARGDLVLKTLFDDDGEQIVIPIVLTGASVADIYMEFRDQVSTLTATALRLLKAGNQAGSNVTRSGADTEVVAEMQRRSKRQLEKILNNFLAALADHLFDLSGRPQSAAMQEDMYESMTIFKRGKDKMLEAFAGQIDAFFSKPVTGQADADQPSDKLEASELNLVDIQDFEDSLSLKRMSRMGTDKYAIPLECLIIRYAEITGNDPLKVRLPVHVTQICEAFRQCIRERGIPNSVAPEIYSFFADQVISRLDAFYTSLNAFLRERGIRPELEEEIKKKGSILKRLDAQRQPAKQPTKKAPPPEAAAEEPPDEEEAERLKQQARDAGLGDGGKSRGGKDVSEKLADQLVDVLKKQFNPDDLYRSVIDALNFRRENDGGGDDSPLPMLGSMSRGGGGSAASGGTNPAGSSALASALSSLQGSPEVRTELKKKPSLREYLSEHRTNIEELKDTTGFAPDSLNQIDLVDNLFNDISTDVDVTPDLKPVVGDLQIPLAKLALLEPQFFANRDHPARGVIDKVAQLSSSANYPNRALETRVSAIIDNIVKTYRDDSNVFQSALNDLELLSEQQKKALERNVERVVKTQDGQQKLQKAQKAVDKILRSRVRPPNAPKPIIDLVNSGWRDLLTLTHVKQGPNSKAWKEYVKTLDLLSLWLIEKQKGVADEQMQVERGLEAEPFVDMIRQQISEALPTSVAHEAVLDNLKDVLSGRAQLEHAPVEYPPEDSTPAPAEVRKKVETLPRLRRWVRRVEDLEQGQWLTFRSKDGARKRMQLAWISEDGDRFIFVNERGQKVAELTDIELARQLSRGVKPPSPSEELPLVDQSMYKTLEHVQKSLSFDKNHDRLTRLINRETFLNQLEMALQHAKSKHADHALLCIDIDKFALVNDVYDEVTGDQVLIEFAKLLSQQHGKKVSSARLEGNQFGVLLLDRNLGQATAHAEGIRSDIEESPVAIENDKVSFTVSIGVTAIVDHSQSVEEIMEHAHTAVRQAKDQGRNRVVQYHDDHKRAEAYKAEEAELLAQIEKTLDTKNFVLQAQPIAATNPRDGQDAIQHYEILLSIEDENGDLHSPQDFITSAERFGYMPQVDRWVVRQVFTWISQMMDEQKVVPNLSINLSGKSVTDDNFMEYLFEQISEYGVGTNKICFEITEIGTISNMVKATDFVNEFKNIGCKFSIDDFGTGLASHSYLRELPVDYVKIDGTFIANIHENPKDYAMTKSINDLAHFLGQETIAEFVESDAVIEKLREIGVDYLQGWGVGHPEPLKHLSGKLEMMEK
jgi:diguanylate cyclase (GGDEF)-like protein